MDPAHIYFKNLKIDQDNTFTLNFLKENGIENVIFHKEYDYAVTGLKIIADLPDKDLIKKSDQLKQDEISQKIQELIKNYKEPDLTLFMSHPETKTIEIPFVKKSQSDLPKIKLTYFNTTTKKNEDFFMYDFIGHFEKFGFEWNQADLGLKYEIKIDSSDD